MFSCTSSFHRYLLLLIKVVSYLVKHMLMKNINIHSVNLLNFDCIVVFDVEAAIETPILVVLERLELQMFFSTS